MADLISRDDYREILDEQLRHYDDGTNPFHMQILKLQREILDDMPAVDAIPVEWLQKKRKYASEGDSLDVGIAEVLDMWQKEQEAYIT